MKGFYSVNEMEDYKKAYDAGKTTNSPLEFTLTVLSEDVERLVSDARHEAGMIGIVKAPGLSPEPISVTMGRFNLFTTDPIDPSHKKMEYAMQLHCKEGKTYFFKGFKDVHNDKGFDVWIDTTTLFVTLFDGTDENAPILAIQATTMKAIHAKTEGEKLKALTKFGKYFAGSVWDTYFKK